MKKTILCLVAVVAMALGFTSCDQNPGTIEIKYGFVDSETTGVTNGPLDAYLVTAADVYNAFETAFRSASGYEYVAPGECRLLNRDMAGFRAVVVTLAAKGEANLPADFYLTNEQTERTFRVMYRFIGADTETEWQIGWAHKFEAAPEETPDAAAE